MICPVCGGSVNCESVQEYIQNKECSHCEHCGQAINKPYCVSIGTADIFTENHEEYEWLLAKISAEAIKEFAKRLQDDLGHLFIIHHPVVGELINNLVKEMVGEG